MVSENFVLVLVSLIIVLVWTMKMDGKHLATLLKPIITKIAKRLAKRL